MAYLPAPIGSTRSTEGTTPFLDLHRELNRMFDNFFGKSMLPTSYLGGSGAAALDTPRIEMFESEQEICVTAELPGVKAEDLDVRLEGDTLCIAGEKRSENERQQQNLRVTERSYGQFRRNLPLPFSPALDQARAEFRDGVLTVHVPKPPETRRSRRLEVTQGGADEPATNGPQQPSQPAASIWQPGEESQPANAAPA